MGEQIPTLSLGMTPHWSRGMLGGGCDSVGSLRWSRLLAGAVALWREEPTWGQVCWRDL